MATTVVKLAGGATATVEALVTAGCNADGTGGTAIKEPSEYEALTADIVKLEETESGRLSGGVVVRDVAKITMKWKVLTPSEWATICGQVGDFFQNYKFWNQSLNTWIVREMYPSDRKSGVFKRSSTTGELEYLEGCSVSLIDTRKRN